VSAPRIPPTPRDEWAPELVDYIAELRASVVGQDSDHPKGANLIGTLAGNPALAQHFLAFNGYFLNRSTLPIRYRELLVLRVAHVRGCLYEWGQHVPLATEAGYTAGDLKRISVGPTATGWAPLEWALLKAADELLSEGVVGDAAWGVLAAELDRHQLMDMVFVVGTYSTLATAMRSFGIELDDDLKPYLP
jgi:AhpD family alkylhydroperoxidase